MTPSALIDGFAYLTVSVFTLFMLANIVIVAARFAHQKDLANRVISAIRPVAYFFRMGDE